MSRESVLAQGRVFQEAGMPETILAGSCTVSVNPTTLVTTRTLTATHYSGPALVKYPSLTVSERDVAGQQVTAADIVVKVPIGAPLIPPGDMILVVSSEADPLLAGREFQVKAYPQSGSVSSHRYPVTEFS